MRVEVCRKAKGGIAHRRGHHPDVSMLGHAGRSQPREGPDTVACTVLKRSPVMTLAGGVDDVAGVDRAIGADGLLPLNALELDQALRLQSQVFPPRTAHCVFR